MKHVLGPTLVDQEITIDAHGDLVLIEHGSGFPEEYIHISLDRLPALIAALEAVYYESD